MEMRVGSSRRLDCRLAHVRSLAVQPNSVCFSCDCHYRAHWYVTVTSLSRMTNDSPSPALSTADSLSYIANDLSAIPRTLQGLGAASNAMDISSLSVSAFANVWATGMIAYKAWCVKFHIFRIRMAHAIFLKKNAGLTAEPYESICKGNEQGRVSRGFWPYS